MSHSGPLEEPKEEGPSTLQAGSEAQDWGLASGEGVGAVSRAEPLTCGADAVSGWTVSQLRGILGMLWYLGSPVPHHPEPALGTYETPSVCTCHSPTHQSPTTASALCSGLRPAPGLYTSLVAPLTDLTVGQHPQASPLHRHKSYLLGEDHTKPRNKPECL